VGATTTHFYYNESWQVLEERTGTSTTASAQYVWDARYIDTPIVRFRDADNDPETGTNGMEETRYYLNLHRFVESSGEYRNSEAYFRVGMMITVLQQDCGVRYNPDCIKTDTFINSGEGLIHGIIKGEGGTCANLPVLYAAIGRKLGYPIYVCAARRHLFNRWATSDGRERFNIEGSGQGFGAEPDDYYMHWPAEISPQEVHQGFYLRNLDPAEETAAFMGVRGHCLRDRGLHRESIAAHAIAHQLAPYQPTHFFSMMEGINQELYLHEIGKAPKSYREWEGWPHICRPKRVVLPDSFERINKSRPPFRPTESIVTYGFLEGDRDGL
jgi:hypothetical protein